MEDMITLSRKELQELIDQEVKKKAIGHRNNFGQVQFTAQDLEALNRRYPKAMKLMTTPYRELSGDEIVPVIETEFGMNKAACVYSVQRFYDKVRRAYYHSKKTLYATEIHNMLRKQTLAIYGATTTRDLNQEEFAKAIETYKELKETFLSLYELRLVELEKEVK